MQPTGSAPEGLPSLASAPDDPSVMNEALTHLSPANLKQCYGLTDDDLGTIRSLGKSAGGRLDFYLTRFYDWLEQRPEFRQFFTDESRLRHAQSAQREYWRHFFSAKVDAAYLDRLKVLGSVHAQIGLPVEAYFAGVHLFLDLFTRDVYDGKLDPGDAAKEDAVAAITKLMHIDTVVVISTFNDHTQQIIQEQSSALMELSTPVSVLWEGVLMLPIVGLVDSKRSQDIMNAMLQKISETNARVMILDISGVNVVDTAVANYFIKMTKATMLMGCECVLSGISPAIAQTIVALGIDLAEINTRGTLKDAVAFSFGKIGLTPES